MTGHTGISTGRLILGLAVVLIAGAAVWFALCGGLGQPREIASPDDALRFRTTDPNLIAYDEIEPIPTGMNEPRGIAVDADNNIFVVGDSLVRSFDPNGNKRLEFNTAGKGTSLAIVHQQGLVIWPDYRDVFVATKNMVEVYDPNGHQLPFGWTFDPNCMFSSIAADCCEVFLADDNAAEVLECPGGNPTWHIGRKDPNMSILLRSPHFKVAVWGKEDLVWITNPGRLRVEAYDINTRERKISWGRPSMEIDGFSGCCNPKDIAFLPDGNIVTSEKGLPRVKVYTREGKFICVVAGPESFDQSVHYLDLAVDSTGRILVLDPVRKMVRIFVKKNEVAR